MSNSIDLVQALTLGVVQGLTEFLPVSSSGHLVLVPILTDFSYQGRVIDVAAHVGTLVAVAFYLRAEIITIALAMLRLGPTILIMHGLASCLSWQPFP